MNTDRTQAADDAAISVIGLTKTFSLGFRRRRVEAVRGVSFDVRRGEVFGLVGPNGAGKTTTIKTLMGLIKPTSGELRILGHRVPTTESRREVGYLPEVAHYYDYLRPAEFLDFYGRLYGMPSRLRRERVPEILQRVGLQGALSKPLRKFSKGMLQRIGLAQALIADPSVVLLDEPQSGLDPIGRKEVADIIHELRQQGKTVFFSSHILPDVERICDRVAVMVEGKIVDIGPLNTLLDPKTLLTEVATGVVSESVLSRFKRSHPDISSTRQPEGETFLVPEGADVQALLRDLIEANVRVDSITPRRESLEDVFVREAAKTAASSPSPVDTTPGNDDAG